jgi:hypothetical protein
LEFWLRPSRYRFGDNLPEVTIAAAYGDLLFHLEAKAGSDARFIAIDYQVVERIAQGVLLHGNPNNRPSRARRGLLPQEGRQVPGSDRVFVGEAIATRQF